MGPRIAEGPDDETLPQKTDYDLSFLNPTILSKMTPAIKKAFSI